MESVLAGAGRQRRHGGVGGNWRSRYGVSHHPQAVNPCQFTEILDRFLCGIVRTAPSVT